MSFMNDFDHLKIEMKDIILATNNFDPSRVIGGGGFGKVYKGELFLKEGQITVAFKHLDRRFGQGNIEFWKEIMMLSTYKHENLISLMHYCIEGDEMILVYEYASRGSLDRYLSDASLSWTQRLRICVGAARGLSFLHDPKETQQRVLHRDIKSANILLNEKWWAKVSDFGLSKTAPANQAQTYLISNVVGTPGYCDPLFWELGFLSKESDVYSFGVVLFEVLSGRLCCEYRNGELINILVPKWRRSYDEKRLDEIILLGLKEQMEHRSLNSFSAIAYRCVKQAREERPTMVEIVKELEFALEQQEILENLGKKVDLAELIRIADVASPPLPYGSHSQLPMLLLKGFLVNDGKTWISINMKGEVTKVVSAMNCFFGDYIVSVKTPIFARQGRDTRCKFPYYIQKVYGNRFKVEVNTHFLSPHVTYTIYIVFKYCGTSEVPCYIPFVYKLNEETHYSTSCIAFVKEDGWLMTKLYQFTSYHGLENFSIEFLPRDRPLFSSQGEYAFEGIEFRPVQYKTCEKQEEPLKVDNHLEPELPTDFTDLIKLSNEVIQWTTKKELYIQLRKGFLTIEREKPLSIFTMVPVSLSKEKPFIILSDQPIHPDLPSAFSRGLDTVGVAGPSSLSSSEQHWFNISKDMKKRLMIPASSFLTTSEWTCNSVPEPESRFKVVTKSVIGYLFSIELRVNLQMLSPVTKFSCHLIYKLSDNFSSFEGPMIIGIDAGIKSRLFPLSICLNKNCHPPIIGAVDDKKSPIPLTTCKVEGHPKRRKDGWMEVQFSQVKMDRYFILSRTIEKYFTLSVEEENFRNMNFFGIVIEGIEFRAL